VVKAVSPNELDEAVPKDLGELKQRLGELVDQEEIATFQQDMTVEALKQYVQSVNGTMSINDETGDITLSYKNEHYNVELQLNKAVPEDYMPEDDGDEEQEEGEGEEGEKKEEGEEGEENEDEKTYAGGIETPFTITLAPHSKLNAKLRFTCHTSKRGDLTVDYMELSEKDGTFKPEDKADVVLFETLQDGTREYLLDLLDANRIDDETAMFAQKAAEAERNKNTITSLKKLKKWLTL